MNTFLAKEPRDVDTALLLEKAIVCDCGGAPACTNGDKVFINTEDNLHMLFPVYNDDVLKWLLWHEEYHKLLKHHSRYFKYLNSATEQDRLKLTKEEVNIIMDILVHDTLSRLFPEIVPTMKINGGQFRNRNELKYTFKTNTLEKMLKEYSEHKQEEENQQQSKTTNKSGDTETDDTGTAQPDTDSTDKSDAKATGEEEQEKNEAPDDELQPEHDLQNWEDNKTVKTEELIDDIKAREYMMAVNKLKATKVKMARITETLNGLVTDTRVRTYRTPSPVNVGNPRVILKGRKPSKAKLYLCFDASGSMHHDLNTFKEIIQNAVPQALNTPCDWFTDEYFHGTFKDMLSVVADSGYNDDGDRVIQLCYEAEQKGYSPIGVTDGGGGISHDKTYEIIKKLKRTTLVGNYHYFLNDVSRCNPSIKTICTNDDIY